MLGVVLIVRRANAWCESHGVTVGILGPRPQDIARLEAESTIGLTSR
jgi:hypothetical protein